MRRVIVGTAGHIDHGKTRLVEALTGIDCDRWDEERERGITIDLGFAHLSRNDLQIGFIDVPGHERFLHNALAGLGGIRIVLLVVAADEGVKPQTIEHLEICSLLKIPHAIVALTKTDLVSDDLVGLARLEVEELLAESPWPQAEIVPVSSVSGDGVPGLLETIVARASEAATGNVDGYPARLPIDRAFQFRGLGSIVTGTLVSGSVAVGDALAVLPAGPTARVRSVQVHGEERPRALAGERTALQLSGVSLADLERGQQLATPDSLRPSTSLLVRLDMLPDGSATLSGSTPIRLHLLSSEVVGRLRPLDSDRVEPGDAAVAQIRLAAPVAAVRGDRFIVRRPSPPATLGGGSVLDPWWTPRKGARLRRTLEQVTSTEADAVRQWADDTGLLGLVASDVARRLGVDEGAAAERLSELESADRLTAVASGQGRPLRWIVPDQLERLGPRVRDLVERYLRRERLAAGMPKAELLRRTMPGVPTEMTRVYLERLEAETLISVRGDLVTLPGREARLTDEEAGLAGRLTRLYEEAGLRPPPPAEAARATQSKPQIVDGVVHYLIQQGKLVRIGSGLVISAAALDTLRGDLVASGMDEFTVADFRDRYDLTRKWAIPILEHLDLQRVTHRVGDVRRVARTPGGSR